MVEMQHILNALPSGLMVFQGDQVHMINEAARSILDLPDGVNCFADFPPKLSRFLTRIQQADGDIYRGELGLNGRQLGYTLKLLDNDTRLVVFLDITQVVRDRQLLEKVQEELNDSKNLASIGLLISKVSHELKNPLTSISMSVSLACLLLERMTPGLPMEALVYTSGFQNELEKMEASLRRANELIEELLTLGKPMEISLTIEPLGPLVEGMIQAVKAHPRFSQVDIRLLVPSMDELLVRCDKTRLEQVFYNILKNACEALEGQGNVQVQLMATEERITLHISDSGPGIPEDIQSRIFEPFFSTKGQAGVGLGLNISAQTIEKLGGTIQVNSPPGSGAIFVITLPRYQDKAGRS